MRPDGLAALRGALAGARVRCRRGRWECRVRRGEQGETTVYGDDCAEVVQRALGWVNDNAEG